MIVELKKAKTQEIISNLLSAQQTDTIFLLTGRLGETLILDFALKFDREIRILFDNSLRLFNREFLANSFYLIRNKIEVIESRVNNFKYLVDAILWEGSAREIPYCESRAKDKYSAVHPVLHWYNTELLLQVKSIKKENPDIVDFYLSSWSKKGWVFNGWDRVEKRQAEISDSEHRKVADHLRDLGYL
jgi:hypothetical protein